MRLDLPLNSVCSWAVIDCSAQQYCNIHSFSSDPYTHTYTHAHTHSFSLFCSSGQCWLRIYGDQKNRQRADNTRSFGSRQKGCTGWQNLLLVGRSAWEHFMRWSVFILTFPSPVFIKNKKYFCLYGAIHTWHFIHLGCIDNMQPDEIKWKKKPFALTDPPPAASASLSYHWLVAGLATCQRAVSTGCLSPPRKPSKPMNRTQWTEGGLVLMPTWQPLNLRRVFWLLPQGIIMRCPESV